MWLRSLTGLLALAMTLKANLASTIAMVEAVEVVEVISTITEVATLLEAVIRVHR